jgi:hypothetical protein
VKEVEHKKDGGEREEKRRDSCCDASRTRRDGGGVSQKNPLVFFEIDTEYFRLSLERLSPNGKEYAAYS